MADEADIASIYMEALDEISIQQIRKQVAMIPEGVAGDCDYCGDYFERLVNAHCGRCRDLLRLP